MNEKASVSKELDAKHKKILEGLLKLPANKLCADCKAKGPRWASVNLGIFVCMQCSGIHRSMGVHISKVRSATLDTWLPEQVEFIQSMGNEKANSYWEAELPPNYDRVGIENFIRAKYEDKRWIPKSSISRPPSQVQEGHLVSESKKSNDRHAQESTYKTESPGEHKNLPQKDPQKDAQKHALLVPKLPSPVSSGFKVQPVMPKTESQGPPQTEPIMVDTTYSRPPKVDHVKDLFDTYSMVGPQGNGSQPSSADDNSWANFQSVEPVEAHAMTNEEDMIGSVGLRSLSPSGNGRTESRDLFDDSNINAEAKSYANERGNGRRTESKSQSSSGNKDLFKDSTHAADLLPPEKSEATASAKTQKNVKDDILNLFDKSNMVSPFAIHQQQLAFLSQQQALLTVAAKSDGTPSTHPNKIQQLSATYTRPNNAGLATNNWPNLGFQIPGMAQPGVQKDGNIFSQVGNILASPTMICIHPSTLSTDSVGLGKPGDEASSTEASKPSNSSSNDFDFSALTQGLFSKKD